VHFYYIQAVLNREVVARGRKIYPFPKPRERLGSLFDDLNGTLASPRALAAPGRKGCPWVFCPNPKIKEEKGEGR